MLEKWILTLLVLTPNHELNKNPALREEVVGYFNEAGDDSIAPTVGPEFESTAGFMLLWAYEESSLRIDRVGSRGEVGYCQAHGKARATCEVAGYDPTTRRGGVWCMALLMGMGQRKCGSFKRGLYWYASGSCNGTPRAKRITERRLRKWKNLTQ